MQLPPASLAQERHWFRRDRRTNGTRRNMAFAAWMHGAVDEAAFVDAVRALATRHEILRTTLVEQDGRVWQRVHQQPMVTCEVVDLRGDATARQAAVATVSAAADAEFDLTNGPLARITLHRVSKNEYLFALVCNHVVGDGWSFAIALDELGRHYRGHRGGEAPPTRPAPLTRQYADYATWQHDWITGPEAREQTAYWIRVLRDRPGKQLPRRLGAASGAVPIELDADLTGRLREYARTRRTTLFVVLLTAYAMCLRELIGDDDVLVAVAVARRQRPWTHPLIGFFAGAVCLRLSLGGDPVFDEAVRRVHETCMAGLTNEEVDLTTYLRLAEPDRDEDADPIACASFFLEPSTANLSFAGIPLDPVPVSREHAPNQLEAELHDEGDRISGRVRYPPGLFDDRVAHDFIVRYRALLTSGVDTPVA